MLEFISLLEPHPVTRAVSLRTGAGWTTKPWVLRVLEPRL